jgi:hypothetical protein
MRSLLLVLTTIVLMCRVSASKVRASDETLKADAAQLKTFDEESPLLTYWNGEVVADTRLVLNLSDLTYRNLTVPDLDSVEDLGSDDGIPLAIGSTNGARRLIRKTADAWMVVGLPESLKNTPFTHFIQSDDGIALMHIRYDHEDLASEQNTLFVLRSKHWDAIKVPLVPHFVKYVKSALLAAQLCLHKGKLIAGWNEGEWGGMVAELNISKANPQWTQISGYDYITPQGLPGNPTITGMIFDKNKHLWLSEGLQHLGIMARGLYRFDGDHWETIVHGSSNESAPDTQSLPGVKSDITAIVMAANGQLYLLASELGVFSYGEGKFTLVIPPVWLTVNGLSPKGVLLHCSPSGIVVDEKENVILTASNCGVLCFLKTKDGYRLRQAPPPPLDWNK